MPQGWTLIPPKKPANEGWSLIGTNAPGQAPASDAPVFGSTPYGADSSGGGYGGPGSIDIPGYTPDYKGLIANDAGYLQLQADAAAGSVSDRASLAAARQRGLTQFGEVPDDLIGANLGLVGGDFNQDIGNARELARQNTAAGLSTVARLGTQNQDAVRTITNALAGRGLLRSGETGYQQGRQGERYTQAQFDARQKLVDFMAGIMGQFTQNERARQNALAQGIFQAENNATARYPGTPGSVATRGADGVFRTPDGREYNEDGSKYTGPKAPPPPPANYAPLTDWQAPPPPPGPPRAPGVGGVQYPGG